MNTLYLGWCFNFVEHISKKWMEKSNLISVLRTFSKKEIRDLRKWLQSPIHNQREDVVQLLDYLVEGSRLNKEDLLEKQVVFPWIYPKETYNDAKMRQCIFFLMRCVEEFLVYQSLQADGMQRKITLAREYRHRKLDKAYQKSMKGAHGYQQQEVHRNGFFYRNEYLLQQEQYNYTVGRSRAIPMNLQQLSDTMDISFIADKLRQTCHMLSHQKVYKTDYEIGLIDEVLQHLEKRSDLLAIPAIGIYYYGYKTITEEEVESHFKNLKQLLFEHGRLFPKPEISDIQRVAINYCIRGTNLGFRNYFRELFELYQQGLEFGTLIDNGIFSRYTFSNVVTTGTILREYDWVENFIGQYAPYLEERYRESMVHYSMAKLHFEKGDYDRAMILLRQVEYDDILVNLSAKTMLLKMFYEREEFDALESLLESVRSFMQRKKVIGYHKSNYKNIIRYTRKLLKVNPYNKTALQRLGGEIEAANPLTEREWLLRQLERM